MITMHLSGRVLFASAIIAFGVLCLIYVDFVNALEPVPAATPGYSLLAILTAVILITSGLAIIINNRAYMAPIVLTLLFGLWIVSLHLPSALNVYPENSNLYSSSWWTRTFETLALAGGALILAGLGDAALRERWIQVGRLLFGISLPVFGIQHLMYADYVATLVPGWIPWPLFWVYFTGLAHAAAGIAIVSGIQARLAAILAGIMYGSWALLLHIPRLIGNPANFQSDRAEWTSLFLAVAFWGAAWIVAGSLSGQDSRVLTDRRKELNPRPVPYLTTSTLHNTTDEIS